jgi:rhodanese-related sulfurtransferase
MYYLVALSLFVAPFFAVNAAPTTKESHSYSEIHTKELKTWIDQGKSITLIDSRSKPYFDKNVIPNAKWVSYEVTDKELNDALPSKDATIVVYCWSVNCPASKYMADRLTAAGYKNVYKYPEGLYEWIQNKYPTQKL